MAAEGSARQSGRHVIGLASQLGTGHILEAGDAAALPGLDDNFLELFDFGQAAENVDRKLKTLSRGRGGWPICPAATCTFCSRMALRTSPVVMPRDLSLWGSSQIRML